MASLPQGGASRCRPVRDTALLAQLLEAYRVARALGFLVARTGAGQQADDELGGGERHLRHDALKGALVGLGRPFMPLSVRTNCGAAAPISS